MDDYNSNVLNDSKNEWCIRLMNVLSGHIIDGFRSIFNEALTLCEKNDEVEKYLMTFQNLLSKIKDWNQHTVESECNRIREMAHCPYLEDLVTCVHVIQLKLLSCVRVTNKNKKIDIDIPDVNLFLHKIYINIARKLYSNIYLFQIDVTPLDQQKNNREFEIIVQTCIMNTIRDNIPIDQILRQYIDETQEVDVETVENIVPSTPDTPEPVKTDPPASQENLSESTESTESNEEKNEEKNEQPISLVEPNAVKVNMNANNPENDIVKEPELNVSFSNNNDVREIEPLEDQFEKETTLNIDNNSDSIDLNIESLDDLFDETPTTPSSKKDPDINLDIEVLEL